MVGNDTDFCGGDCWTVNVALAASGLATAALAAGTLMGAGAVLEAWEEFAGFELLDDDWTRQIEKKLANYGWITSPTIY